MQVTSLESTKVKLCAIIIDITDTKYLIVIVYMPVLDESIDNN